ncbi:hypothetical protein [Flavobacterium soyangense]|uniref:Uncharacterized protein n=1 Tax=Flavobacterium soyangense TaxID=2023265 RepID=A0A930UDR8_9FLAO|nr:hypothetical protein [Flavobacterium soyangense]MBF2709466.1 hypothetical protein [Flavobacterium soyangense]
MKKKHWQQITLSIIIILIFIWLADYYNNLFNSIFIDAKTTKYYEIYGNFGSYLGGVLGTIIGFVTLILVYKTYSSQRKELKIQKELITQQQFESTFFNMLNVHRELKNGLKLNKENNFLFDNNNLDIKNNRKFYDFDIK